MGRLDLGGSFVELREIDMRSDQSKGFLEMSYQRTRHSEYVGGFWSCPTWTQPKEEAQFGWHCDFPLHDEVSFAVFDSYWGFVVRTVHVSMI